MRTKKTRKEQVLVNFTDSDKEQYRELLESHGYHNPHEGMPLPSNTVASWVIDPNDHKYFAMSGACRAAMAQTGHRSLSLEELKEYLEQEEK